MSPFRSVPRVLSGTAAAALALALAAGLAPAVPAAAAAPAGTAAPGAAAQQAADGTVLRSAELAVRVADDFPRVLGYTDRATGATLGGSTAPVTSVTLNGTAYPVDAELRSADARTARYTLAFPDLPGVELDASLSLRGRVTAFRVDAVRDTAAFRVGTLDVPGHDLVSVASTQPGAATAFTTLDPDSTRTADRFARVTADTPADAQPVGASYALLNTDRLAAAVESNSSYDRPSGPTNGDDARLWHRAREDADGTVRVGVWSGQWTYRGDGAPAPERELPWAKVVVTPDANGDGEVDWQDGAVAFRAIGTETKGGDETPDRVVTHIPFNFASQATHPFLRTLDDVKRISLATDGLGQLALLKGYQSEGHDSAHPDYGGNVNKRAGGLRDLNTLLRRGEDWGATFGVHVNATEAYPVANNFSDELVDADRPGWNWLDQSYYIDQRRDLNSGGLARRLRELREETHPNLSLLYIDVYYTHGWIADRTLAEVQRLGFDVATEWSDKFERGGSLWSHWANDLDYGGTTNKGLNSQIIRFIRNGEKDVWNDHPVLGQTALVDFEGWTGENDYRAFLDNVWRRNLPAKFLQHYDITDWERDEITFTGGVRGTAADGERAVYLGDAQVIDGDSYLLPWASEPGGEHDKLYHWSADGGSSTWTLPEPFADTRAFTAYRLTDGGRAEHAAVRARDGKVTLDAAPGQPYVLYPDRAPRPRDARWGEGGPVRDPGFNDPELSAWRTDGPVRGEADDLGRRGVVLGGGRRAAIEQRITGLAPGERYSASAYVQVEPGRSRRTTITIGGEQVAVERSTAPNRLAADERHGTYYQRVKVHFTAPRGGTATLRVAAADGAAEVGVDDVRIVRNDPAGRRGALVYEDFEAVDQGWGPFVKGGAGGTTDPRTHIAQKHAPYTQAGWNGKLVDDVIGGGESLKAHEENPGLVYRTVPWTVPFEDGRAYRVEFDYQSSHAGAYEWTTGYDSVAGGEVSSVTTRRTPLPRQRTTGHVSEEVVGGCGDVWTGLRKLDGAPDGADFVLDGFTVTDLGPADEAPACATLGVASENAALEPGAANPVTAVFANHEAVAAEDVEVTLDVPEGWTAEPAGPTSFASVAPGARATAAWRVTPPADAAYATYRLDATAAYAAGGAARTAAGGLDVRTLPPPPAADTWASDTDWVSAENGWGPVERDMSNGATGAGDGTPLTIGGTAYAKGLGTHAPADLRYYLGGRCRGFTAEVGVDDAQPTRGSVVFSVWADGEKVAESPVLRAADGPYRLAADVTGARYVRLVVGDAGDGNGNDHASWGAARWLCG